MRVLFGLLLLNAACTPATDPPEPLSLPAWHEPDPAPSGGVVVRPTQGDFEGLTSFHGVVFEMSDEDARAALDARSIEYRRTWIRRYPSRAPGTTHRLHHTNEPGLEVRVADGKWIIQSGPSRTVRSIRFYGRPVASRAEALGILSRFVGRYGRPADQTQTDRTLRCSWRNPHSRLEIDLTEAGESWNVHGRWLRPT